MDTRLLAEVIGILRELAAHMHHPLDEAKASILERLDRLEASAGIAPVGQALADRAANDEGQADEKTGA